jgi:hypothetical protein
MEVEGNINLKVVTNDHGVKIVARLDAGDLSSGYTITSESLAAAKIALIDVLDSGAVALLETLFQNLGETVNKALNLQCPFCGMEFVAEFPEQQPLLLSCPFEGCHHTIVVEELTEVL